MEPEVLQNQIQSAVDYIGPILERAMRTGRYGVGFQIDLAWHMACGRYNVFSILDEVAILEGAKPGPSRTKEATEFIGPRLIGLWHKHHFQARFLPKNLILELKRSDVIAATLRPFAGKEITPDVVNRLTHAVVTENFESRSKDGRLTGEWIIFEKQSLGNLYLTLASHSEGDERIANRVADYRQLEEQVMKKPQP